MLQYSVNICSHCFVVVQGLLAKEVVTYKDHQMFVKIHEEESKSRDYPSTGARNKEPAQGSSSSSNEALQIRNIPSDFKYDQLGMLLSNKRYGGEEFDRLDYTPGGDGTAVVWFKDPQSKYFCSLHICVRFLSFKALRL